MEERRHPAISLIVPAFNEARYLPQMLASVHRARSGYRRGYHAVEVIVADNGSTDATADIAREHGCRLVRVGRRSIAAARNGGAQAARADWLAFVDADSLIHEETFDAIDDALSCDDVAIGATGVRMSRLSAGIRATTLAIGTVNRLRGIDTGVVFCRRGDWAAVGGYDEARLFAEDLAFMLAVKRIGRARGRRFTRPTGVAAVTSSRKYDRHGDWHVMTTLVKSCGWWLVDRNAIDRFARRYWYGDR
ncbi:MAG TPA: glycosyltransferase [Casimicrobiaceae bacterium]|nr:glycosyltransferase [Casimicrobiaceae bacterium]